jgi:hypothetical protein
LITRTPTEAARYARRANRIGIHHPLGHVVALIEIVSPGNKDTRHALKAIVEKSVAFLHSGIHLLIVDLFPPSRRDPSGIHKAILDELGEQPFALPPDKTLALVSYQVATEIVGHVEPVAVGDVMPDMPLFLPPEGHVPVPLQPTYDAAWEACPRPIRDAVEKRT